MCKDFVFLNRDAGAEKSNSQHVRKVSGVADAIEVPGVYDIVGEEYAESENGPAGIARQLRSTDTTKSCPTMIVTERQRNRPGSRGCDF
jgi:hypothetical protein